MWNKRLMKRLCLFAVIFPLPILIIKLQVQYRLVWIESMQAYSLAYSNAVFAVSIALKISGFLASSPKLY